MKLTSFIPEIKITPNFKLDNLDDLVLFINKNRDYISQEYDQYPYDIIKSLFSDSKLIVNKHYREIIINGNDEDDNANTSSMLLSLSNHENVFLPIKIYNKTIYFNILVF